MVLESIIFFFMFMIIIQLVLSVCTFPFVFMINKQFIFAEKKKVLIYTFGFNVVYMIIFIFSRLVSIEFVRISSYYLGLIAILFSVSTFYWILYIILWSFRKREFLDFKFVKYLFSISVIFLFILSIYNFEKPLAVENYIINSSKLDKNYRFVQISDLHFGTVSEEYMNNVFDLALDQNPEFIVFTGDLVDFEDYVRSDFDKFESMEVPIFFERGNHEFYHLEDKIYEYLVDIDSISLLDNKIVNFGELEIVGIDYVRDEDMFEKYLSFFSLDDEKFSILLYHEPKFVEFSAGYGFDLMLYGHTHGGQIFPATLIVDWMYEYSNGFYEIFDTFVYVTDGAGLWGPRMRLGSQNEIVVFDLVKAD